MAKRPRSVRASVPEEVNAERDEAGRVYAAFAGFAKSERGAVAAMEAKVARIAPALLALLPADELKRRFASLNSCAQTNADFVAEVLRFAQEVGVIAGGEDDDVDPTGCEGAVDELRAVIHSLVREWSEEGADERRQIFRVLVDELAARVPLAVRSRGEESAPPRVLVPGSGLGRLPAEISAAGYDVVANELSLQMLLVAGFVANCTSVEDGAVYEVHPFIHQRGNHKSGADQLRAVAFPDISPHLLLGDTPFPTVAGEFLEHFGADCANAAKEHGAWDAVVTCFFIDTAPCVLEYIDAIHRLLAPGAAWLNFGPLLFHWAHPDPDEDASDERFARSLELPWCTVRAAIVAKGFEIVKEEWRSTAYTENAKSMMQTNYECIFFVAIKTVI